MIMQKQKIIYTGLFDPLSGDGASSTTIDLLQFLKSRNHEVSIISFMPDNELNRRTLDIGIKALKYIINTKGEKYCDFNMDGIKTYVELLPLSLGEIESSHPLALNHYLRKIREYPGSYFFTADKDSTCLIAHAILGNPFAHFIHSPDKAIKYFEQDAVLKKIIKDRTVFTVSEYSQKELMRALNIHSNVWPPFVDQARFKFRRTNRDKKILGYYSAGPHKGDNIINSLANEMPDQPFVIMGTRLSAVDLPNVSYLGHITNLDLFYENISILLVPSIIAEGYSRVILEAAFNGVPVIANRIGGIPEAAGRSGILIGIESHDKMVKKYKLAINDLLNDQDKYETYCNKAIERAEEYRKAEEQLSIRYDNEFFS
jgi:glycosyltransferase involved in cell wall biosynthesis